MDPTLIFWEATKTCNLRCSYCRVRSGRGTPELSTQEALRMLTDIKREFPDVLFIVSGGEALMRSDIFEILVHTRNLGLKVSLASNGTFLDEDRVKSLRRCNVSRVSLSLDSTEENVHDKIKGLSGAWQKTLQGIDCLNQYGIDFQINFTVTRSNQKDLEKIAHFAMRHKAVGVHFFVLVPVGCGRDMLDREMLNAVEVEIALKTILHLSRQLPIEIRPTCAPHYVRFGPFVGASAPSFGTGETAPLSDNPEQALSFEGGVNRGVGRTGRIGGCLAGSRIFFISSEGELYPCGYLPVTAGHLRSDPIGEIWRKAPVFLRLRNHRPAGGCSLCSWNNRCRGCRARAYAVTGDYMAEDVTCIKNQRLAGV